MEKQLSDEEFEEWVNQAISSYLKENHFLDYQWLVQSGQIPKADQ